ncbi:MAG TPA: hypothetical protein DC034_11120, partial [Clostridium sp.]|nr:hypothetical protein [Clostridium sp.]
AVREAAIVEGNLPEITMVDGKSPLVVHVLFISLRRNLYNSAYLPYLKYLKLHYISVRIA